MSIAIKNKVLKKIRQAIRITNIVLVKKDEVIYIWIGT